MQPLAIWQADRNFLGFILFTCKCINNSNNSDFPSSVLAEAEPKEDILKEPSTETVYGEG